MAKDKEPQSPDDERNDSDDMRPSADTADAGAVAGDAARDGRQADSATDPPAGKVTDSTDGTEHPWGNVFQHFHGNVYAAGGMFGISSATAPAPRITGRLDEAEISKIVRTYAKPTGYDDAAKALKEERLLILTGQPGSGRRAGAVTMLDGARSPGKPLVGLSPATTLEQLAERAFEDGYGYLICDMFEENLVADLADYHWRSLLSNIRRSKAHLVVTTSVDSSLAKSTAVKHAFWQRPPAAEALQAHLGAAHVDRGVLKQVSEALGPNYPMADIETIARKIAATNDGGDVLAELQDADRLAVAKWLDDVDAQIPAVLEVAALAFVVGVSERVFEAELRHLKPLIPRFATGIDTETDKTQAEIDLKFSQLRKIRNEHPLLTVRQAPVAGGSGALAVRQVDFRAPIYRQHLLSELWNRLDTEFWDTMRIWLHRIVLEGDFDLINSLAIGLALLGLVAPDEVIDSYLNPWTDDDAIWSELTAAVYVVWQMGMHNELASLALQIAIHWAGEGSRVERRAAAFAFSGELGARFPTEAVKRLTQLAQQGELLAKHAHALLFATLAEQGADAAIVLREMRRRMASETDRPSADLVSDAVVDLLSIRDTRSGRPSVALFLIANPLRAAEVAPLWARTLCLRPWRGNAIAALRDAIGAIEHGLSHPVDLVRALGAAIGTELPPDERIELRPELLSGVQDDDANIRKSASRSKPARSQVSASLLEVFLMACASPPPKKVRPIHD